MASPHPPRQLSHPPSSPFGTPSSFPAFPVAPSIAFGAAASQTSSNIPFNLGATNFASANPAGFGFGGAGGWSSPAGRASAGVAASQTSSKADEMPANLMQVRASADPPHARKRRQSSSSSAMAEDAVESPAPDRRLVQRMVLSHGKRQRPVGGDAETVNGHWDHVNADETLSPSREKSGKRARSDEEDGPDAVAQRSIPNDSVVTQKRLRFQADEMRGTEETGTGGAADDVDLGVLLASLPPVTHLQLLHSLVRERPSLRPLLISLLPPPELEYCMVNLEEKFARVVEAVPVGANAAARASPSPTSTIFGNRLIPSPAPGAPAFGASSGVGRIGFGFGSGRNTVVDQPSLISDGYVLNRLRGPVHDVCSTATTYLPYFLPGGKPAPASEADATSSRLPSTPPHASVSFQYLHFLSDLLVTRLLPLLPDAAPAPAPVTALLEDLLAGWRRWIDALSEHVNKGAGMYPASTAEGWHRTLEHLAHQDKVVDASERLSQSPVALAGRFAEGIRLVKDKWVREIGWLIGLHTVVDMDS